MERRARKKRIRLIWHLIRKRSRDIFFFFSFFKKAGCIVEKKYLSTKVSLVVGQEDRREALLKT